MKQNNFLYFLLFSYLILTSEAAKAQCPTPPTKIHPEIKSVVKVSMERNSKIYTYTYQVTNKRDALLSLDSIYLHLSEAPLSVSMPSAWTSLFEAADSLGPSNLYLNTLDNAIKPGATLTFSIRSDKSPGIIKYSASGKTEARSLISVDGDDETIPTCPGFYDDKSMFDSLVSGTIQGPAVADRISLKVKVKHSKTGINRLRIKEEIRPYQETGLLTLQVNSSKDLDVSDIDISSLRFGVGKAIPKWSELRAGNECLDFDDDKIERSKQKLWLQFDIDQAEIECDRDKTLYLEGKTKDGRKTLLGSISPTVVGCEQVPTNPIKKKLWDVRMKWLEKLKAKLNKKK